MAVPYTFGTATASIPLSQLDSNFATTITLGNTAIQLGNTVTTLNNMTLANVTVSSGNVTLTNVAVTTANVTTANITTAVIGTATITTAGITTANVATGNVTTLVTTSVTNSGLTTGRVMYTTTGGLETSSANLLYSGTDLTVYGLTVGRGGGAISTNTAVGASGLAANTSGAFNTSVGATTLAGNTTGVRNTGVGYAALFLGTTASYNSGFGFGTLNANTGDNNTAIGYYSMGLNTSGASNSALGFQALYNNTTASNNTAVGYQAGFSNTTSQGNTLVGYQAGYATTGELNTFVGKSSGAANTSGNYNAAFGWLSGGAITTGINNTFIGTGAGSGVSTGSKNTVIGNYNGNQSGLDIRTASNYIVLSDGDGNIVASAKTAQTFALQGGTLSSGTGIAFPATQSASTDANTLDDYEEGTWTPTVTATGISGVTYARQIGWYTKIGNAVSVMFTADLSSKGTGGSGQIAVSGLPFTPGTYGANLLTDYSILVDNLDAARYQCHIQILQSDTSMGLIASGSTTGSHTGLTWAQIGNSSVFRCGLTYLSV
jgi:hypothetical protein